ncbi:MAG TPA: hypothetical protein VKH13_13375, partial [Steroidobacteraceae bacterium]|nr:hypothetical protein [Steroidobacteraceae bacterium]
MRASFGSARYRADAAGACGFCSRSCCREPDCCAEIAGCVGWFGHVRSCGASFWFRDDCWRFGRVRACNERRYLYSGRSGCTECVRSGTERDCGGENHG